MKEEKTEEELRKELFDIHYQLQMLARHTGNPDYEEKIENLRNRLKETKLQITKKKREEIEGKKEGR